MSDIQNETKKAADRDSKTEQLSETTDQKALRQFLQKIDERKKADAQSTPTLDTRLSDSLQHLKFAVSANNNVEKQKALIELVKLKPASNEALQDFLRNPKDKFDRRDRQLDFARAAASGTDKAGADREVIKLVLSSLKELAKPGDKPADRDLASLDLSIARQTLSQNRFPDLFMTAKAVDISKELQKSLNPINVKDLRTNIEILSAIKDYNPHARKLLDDLGLNNKESLAAFEKTLKQLSEGKSPAPSDQQNLVNALAKMSKAIGPVVEATSKSLLQEVSRAETQISERGAANPSAEKKVDGQKQSRDEAPRVEPKSKDREPLKVASESGRRVSAEPPRIEPKGPAVVPQPEIKAAPTLPAKDAPQPPPQAAPQRGWQPAEAMKIQDQALRSGLSDTLGVALGRRNNDTRDFAAIMADDKKAIARPITEAEWNEAGKKLNLPASSSKEAIRAELLKRLGLEDKPGSPVSDAKIRNSLSWNEEIKAKPPSPAEKPVEKKAPLAPAVPGEATPQPGKPLQSAPVTVRPDGASKPEATTRPENGTKPVAPALEGAKKPGVDVPPLPGKPTDGMKDGMDKTTVLKGQQLTDVRYLQDTLTIDLPGMRELKTNDVQGIQALKDEAAAIQKEKTEGVYGPATARAFADYIKWMETRAVTDKITELDRLKIPPPPNCPLKLPMDANQRAKHPEVFRGMVARGELKLDLGIDTKTMPGVRQLDKIDEVKKWLLAGKNLEVQAANAKMDRTIEKIVKENNLPKDWAFLEELKPGEKTRTPRDIYQGMAPEAYRAAASSVVDLTVKVRNYADAMMILRKESPNGDFPCDLPPGATRVKVGEKEVIKLDLPEDLRLNHPANAEKVERLRQWMDDHKQVLEDTLLRVSGAKSNPDAVLQWGDTEITNGLKGRFDSQDRLIGLVDPKVFKESQLKPGETLKDMNLMENRFDVTTKDGKIVVTQHVQAQMVPWWGYQNLAYDNVGKAMDIKTQEYDPEDFVPINKNGHLQVIKAKDLESYKLNQEVWHYGEKIVTAVMDGAMIVSGTIELRAACKAAMVAEKALQLTTTQFCKEAGAASVKTLAGGLGILNNARGHQQGSDLELLNQARGLYFVADIGKGLVQGATRSTYRMLTAAKAAESAPEVLASSQKIEKSLESMGWATQKTHKYSQMAFKGIEYPMAGVVGRDFLRSLDEINRIGERDGFADARQVYGDGRGLQPPAKGAFDKNNPVALKGATDLLDNYKAILTSNRTDATKQQVIEILDKTKKLMGPEVTDEQRKQYVEELYKQISFDENKLKNFELARPTSGPITDDEASDLHDALKLQQPDAKTKQPRFGQGQQKMAQDELAKIDPDVQAARALAFLYLSRDKDGNLPKELASNKVTIKGYSIGEDDYMPTHDVKQTLTSNDVYRMLMRDAETTKSGNRGLVTGDTLFRLGAIDGRAYCGMLQDILIKQPPCSAEDKMRALTDPNNPRFAAVIDVLRAKEALTAKLPKAEREAEEAKYAGCSSKDLLATLAKVAKEDPDANVRAMAAIISYGTQLNDNVRHQKILVEANQKYQELSKAGGAPNAFADWAKNELLTDIAKPIPDVVREDKQSLKLADQARESKLEAALHLALITPQTDAATQKLVTAAIAESISSTDRALSLRAIESLLPNRINELNRDNPNLASEVRRAAVNQCDTPLPTEPALSPTAAAQLVKLLGMMPALLKEGNNELLRNDLVNKLQNSIDGSAGNRKSGRYAEYNPEIRAAAIETLADLGSRNSLDHIRACLTNQPTLTIGGKTLPANEQDATVRRAAALALEKLGDPLLRNITLDLIDKETDPNVARVLRNVEFSQQRIPRDSREWKKIFEEAEAKLLNPRNDFKCSDEEALKLITDRYPLLDSETFIKAKRAAEDDTSSWYAKNVTLLWTGSGVSFLEDTFGDRLQRKTDAGFAKEKEREEQWKSLCTAAMGAGDDGNKSKAMLYYIMKKGGSPCANKLEWTGGVGTTRDNSVPYWEAKAAKALADCCKAGTPGRSLAFEYVRQGLLYSQDLSTPATLALLEGWRELGKENNPSGLMVEGSKPNDFREVIARTTAQALQRELDRGTQQNDQIQKELIKDLLQYKDRTVLPVLEAIANRGHEKVRDYAKSVVGDLRDSVAVMWNDTTPDQVATPAQRASAIKLALNEATKGEQTVQAIAAAYKGYVVPNDKDPAVPYLEFAMNDSNTMVKIAACKVISESKLDPNSRVVQSAVTALSTIAATGAEPRYKAEATEILRGMLGKLEKLEMKIDDRTSRTIYNTPAGISMIEIRDGQKVSQTTTDGKTLSWKRDEKGTVTEFTNPVFGVCTKQPDGTFKSASGANLNYFKMGDNGSCIFEDQTNTYTLTSAGAFEQKSKTVKTAKGTTIQYDKGKPISMTQTDRRGYSWDGDTPTGMTYTSKAGKSMTFSRLKDERGQWSNNWELKIDGMGTMTHSGTLTINNDGGYIWGGSNGYSEWQDPDGEYRVSPPSSGSYDPTNDF